MPTVTFTATGRRHDGVVDLRVEFANGDTLTRTVTAAKINTPAKLAAWLLAQQPDSQGEATELRRAFSVTYHLTPEQQPIIDTVTTAEPADDAAWAVLASSQLGTITLAAALAAVDNATTLAQLKAVVRAVVQVVIPMRDVIDRVMTRLRRLGLR
jgi:hypothetical protein